MSGIDFIEKIREKDTNCKGKIILSSAFITMTLLIMAKSLNIDKNNWKANTFGSLKRLSTIISESYSSIQIKYFYKIDQNLTKNFYCKLLLYEFYFIYW